jgi:hypothetical protein
MFAPGLTTADEWEGASLSDFETRHPAESVLGRQVAMLASECLAETEQECEGRRLDAIRVTRRR